MAPSPSPPQVCGLSLVYEGAPLKMKPKLDYIARKEEERKSRPNAAPAGGAAGGAAGAAAAGRKRRAEAEPEEGGDGEGEEVAAEEEAEVEVPEYEPGCVLTFDFGEAEFAEVR